jgi:PAS domain S-box-containing protein
LLVKTKVPASRRTFERQLLAFFLLLVGIAITIVIIYKRISNQSKSARNWVSHTQNVLAKTDSLMALQKDIVIATRGFVITGDTASLRGYEAKEDSLHQGVTRLEALIRDNAVQQRRLEALQAHIRKHKAIRQAEIALVRSGQSSSQDEVQFVRASDKALSELHLAFTALRNKEREILTQHRATYQESMQDASRAIFVLLLIFVLSLLLAFILVFRNTVRRNKAEAALRKNEGLIREIIDHAPLLINVKDRAGRYLLVNKQMATALNTGPEELIGKTSYDFLSLETADPINSEDQQVLTTGVTSELQVQLPGPDGLHTYITSKFPLVDSKGRLYAIGSTSADITPIKKAHEALHKSYEQQQRILNGLQEALSASADVLCIINEQGQFAQVSDTVKELLGYTPKELMSKNFLDFVVPEDRAHTEAVAAEIMSGRPVADFTNHYIRKDGITVPVIWSAKWLEADQAMYCIARSGEEMAKTAEQLAQSQARLAHAQTIARMGNWELDLKSNTMSCSDEMYRLIGVDKKDVESEQQAFFLAIHPDDREMMKGVQLEALTTGKKIDIEHRALLPDGTVRYMHTKGEVVFDEDHKPIWLSGTMQDITERKKTQLALEHLNRNLQQRAQELKASNNELERFAYVASHDLQEPLRMVSSFLALLQKKLTNQLDDTAKTYIHYAVDGAERMKGLIQDLLQYSRLGTQQEALVPVNLNEVMDQVEQTYALAVRESGGEIKRATLPVVRGHKSQLTQLFQNLVGNALKYRSEAAPIIEIYCEEKEDHWVFSVRDNGIGIDPKFFDKIFIIFQRLHQKSEYSGTGIGLAICKKIAERHGGTIWVASTSGAGSTFYFTLKKQAYA